MTGLGENMCLFTVITTPRGVCNYINSVISGEEVGLITHTISLVRSKNILAHVRKQLYSISYVYMSMYVYSDRGPLPPTYNGV